MERAQRNQAGAGQGRGRGVCRNIAGSDEVKQYRGRGNQGENCRRLSASKAFADRLKAESVVGNNERGYNLNIDHLKEQAVRLTKVLEEIERRIKAFGKQQNQERNAE